MPNLFSDIAAEDGHWTTPDLDHAALLGVVGHGVNSDRTVTRNTLINTSAHSPLAVAFVAEGEEDFIYIGYHPTNFPANVAGATAYDDHAMVLVGNDLDAAIPMVLPDDTFTRGAATTAYDITYITGANGHANAAGAVFRFDHTASGTGSTNDLRFRRVFPLSRTIGIACLQAAGASGRLSLLAFYTTALHADLGSGTPAIVAAATPLSDWYRVAVMNNNAALAVPVTQVGVIPPASITDTQALTRRGNVVVKDLLSRLGVGGPALTTAAFQQGMTDLQNTHTMLNQNVIDYHTNRDNKGFSDRHGPALGQRVQNWCNVPNDLALPEVHRLAAAAHKHQLYGILSNQFQTRALASSVPLTLASAPLATTKLVDEVFRNYTPGGTGLVFAQGLSPFAVVCEGHAERELVVKKIRQATMAEQGSTLSLADAEALTSTDVRFAAEPQVAAEKLYGWACILEVFHGPGHSTAVNTVDFALKVGPALHRIHQQHAKNPAMGMDLVNRVLYEAQQDYFTWLDAAATDPAALAPTYARIKNLVLSFRVNSLSTLPASWYTLFDAPRGSGREPARGERPSTRELAGAVGGPNPHADAALKARFAGSGHGSISDLMAGHDVAIPKQGNKEVCLSWALKGHCGRTCKRNKMHVRYGPATVHKLHQLLTECGVANPQE